MDYEKKYKNALELAKDYHEDKNCFEYLKGVLENIFPELSESEDEKIRKALIQGLNDINGEYNTLGGVFIDNILAWLEKQGEQKPYGQREECFNCQFNYAGHCKGYCELKRQDKSTFEQCKQKGDRIVTNPDGTHFNLYQLERVATAETPEESLGISSEKYNKIVNECIFGELKETEKESNSNDRLDPLIDEEIDLWIKENKDIHHDNNDIVELMRDMAYYVATLTRNLYKQKPKWTEEDSLMIDSIIDTMKWLEGKGATNMKIDFLKGLKQRMEKQQ